jgi:mannose/fructose-specific phosphotransferase system component IIA
MTKGIIICHGQLAFELIKTVEKILGDVSGLYPFSNALLTPEVLNSQIAKFIEASNTANFVIMVDLRGGNCWKVAKMLNRDFPSMKLLSGVNIPMLISFLTKRDKTSLSDLTEILEVDTHRGVVLE